VKQQETNKKPNNETPNEEKGVRKLATQKGGRDVLVMLG